MVYYMMFIWKYDDNMEGTRPLTGPALPNLINAVRMLKSKPQNGTGWCCRGGFGLRRDKDVDVDFKHFDCIYKVG